MSYFCLSIVVCAAISTAAAGCTVQKIESQPLSEIRTEVEQAYRHETGQTPPPQLPMGYRMRALLDSALERAYQSPCDNDVVFYYAAHFGWSMSCDRCLDYSGRPWRYPLDYAAPPGGILTYRTTSSSVISRTGRPLWMTTISPAAAEQLGQDLTLVY